MAKLSANLSWLFTERPLRERFAAAAACGFRAVEILWPYELTADEIASELQANDLELVLINFPAGDMTKGEGAKFRGDRVTKHASTPVWNWRVSYAQATSLSATARDVRTAHRRHSAFRTRRYAGRESHRGRTALRGGRHHLDDRAAERERKSDLRLAVDRAGDSDSRPHKRNRTSRCNSTSITSSTPRVTRSNARTNCAAASPTSKSPAAPTATNPTPANST